MNSALKTWYFHFRSVPWPQKRKAVQIALLHVRNEFPESPTTKGTRTGV
jgi:hypothetical protein